MNVELLEKVKQHILEEPLRLDMTEYLYSSEDSPCGAIGCLAGWTVMIGDGIDPKDADKIMESTNVRVRAAELLGLTYTQAEKLFYFKQWRDGMFGWPDELAEKYSAAVWSSINPIQIRQKQAQITAARIDRFIASGGAE